MRVADVREIYFVFCIGFTYSTLKLWLDEIITYIGKTEKKTKPTQNFRNNLRISFNTLISFHYPLKLSVDMRNLIRFLLE